VGGSGERPCPRGPRQAEMQQPVPGVVGSSACRGRPARDPEPSSRRPAALPAAENRRCSTGRFLPHWLPCLQDTQQTVHRTASSRCCRLQFDLSTHSVFVCLRKSKTRHKQVLAREHVEFCAVRSRFVRRLLTTRHDKSYDETRGRLLPDTRIVTSKHEVSLRPDTIPVTVVLE